VVGRIEQPAQGDRSGAQAETGSSGGVARAAGN
jgi:hypothetical protein